MAGGRAPAVACASGEGGGGAAAAVGSAMGKKHKKHKAEKTEWRSASAVAYSGKNWRRYRAGGSVFVPVDASTSFPLWLSPGPCVPSWAGSRQGGCGERHLSGCVSYRQRASAPGLSR